MRCTGRSERHIKWNLNPEGPCSLTRVLASPHVKLGLWEILEDALNALRQVDCIQGCVRLGERDE